MSNIAWSAAERLEAYAILANPGSHHRASLHMPMAQLASKYTQ